MTGEPSLQQTTALSVTRLLQALREGELGGDIGLMRWSSNYTFLTTITFEDLNFMVIYKPRSGERPLWDFPDGTLCLREVAAWEAAQALGWNIVPPTVLREGAHGPGSVQFFVEHDPELTYFTFPPEIQPWLRRLSLFDHIVNNADRKGGHCLLDGQGQVWGIDHGLTFNTDHRLRTVIWDFAGQQIPPALLNDIAGLRARLDDHQSAFSCRLAELLDDSEIAALQRRVAHLLQQRRWPQPGRGPNVPWPPV